MAPYVRDRKVGRDAPAGDRGHIDPRWPAATITDPDHALGTPATARPALQTVDDHRIAVRGRLT